MASNGSSAPFEEPLYDTRERLVKTIQSDLDENERHFLLSLKRGEPEWTALDIERFENLPALQWKLFNIRKWIRGSETPGWRNSNMWYRRERAVVSDDPGL